MCIQSTGHRPQRQPKLVPVHKNLLRSGLFGLLIIVSFQASAVLPVGFIVGELLFGTIARAAFTATTALGSTLAWVSVKSPTDSDPTSTSAATIEVQLDPNAPLTQDVPAGWTPPASGQIHPTPPSTTALSLVWDAPSSLCKGLASHTEAAQCQVSNHHAGASITNYTVQATTGGQPSLYLVTLSNSITFQVGRLSTCPTGYNVSGSSCALSNANTVVKPSDGKCTILRTGNNYAGDSRDPDCGAGSLSGSGVTITGGTVKIGQPSKTVEITTGSDGSTTIKEKTADTGTNSTVEKGVNLDPTNKVTGTSSNTYNGTGTGQSTTPQTGSTINLPTDYNRESTQQSINTKLGQIREDLTTSPDVTSLQTEKDALDAKYDQLIDNISALGESGINSAGTSFSWFPDLPSATCTPLSYGVPGHMYTIDHCETAARVRAIAGYVFYIFTGFLLFAVLTGKNSGE